MSYYPLTNTISIYHQVKISGKDSYNATPDYTQVDVSILPMGDNIIANIGLNNAFVQFQCFVFEEITVKNGDKIIDDQGDTYYVQGVPQVYDLKGKYYQQMIIQKMFGV